MSDTLEHITVKNIAKKLEEVENEITGIDIKRGKLGLALFYLLYGDYTNDQAHYDHAVDLITATIETLNDNYNSFNISLEFSELGRFLEFVKHNYGIDFEEEDFFDFLDDYQSADQERTILKGDCDPYTGCLVSGYYFLARIKSNPSLVKKVEEVVHAIADHAEIDENGNLYWISQLHNKREIFLGLSHGNTSIILFLYQVYQLNILPEKCLEIIKKGADFILSKSYTRTETELNKLVSFYPTIVDEIESSPLCWCYGDLGIAIAFNKIGLISPADQKYSIKANEIFLNSILRTEYKDTRLGDAGLCYGVSGTSLMFRQFYEETGNKVYLEKSEYWHNRIYDFSIHTDGPLGFKGMFNQQYPTTNLSFNEGIAGIGCTILSKLNNNYTALNEFLNIS
jgi:lantibiotic modifying enzyme